MSITLNRHANLEPPTTTLLDGITATTVHTPDTNYQQIVEAIVLANVDTANTCYVILAWTDATPTDTTFWTGTVAAGSTTIIDNIPIVTRSNGKVRGIKATAAAANDIYVTVITSGNDRQYGNAQGT